MQDQVIICDLDNTIFDTSSIDPELFRQGMREVRIAQINDITCLG